MSAFYGKGRSMLEAAFECVFDDAQIETAREKGGREYFVLVPRAPDAGEAVVVEGGKIVELVFSAPDLVVHESTDAFLAHLDGSIASAKTELELLDAVAASAAEAVERAAQTTLECPRPACAGRRSLDLRPKAGGGLVWRCFLCGHER